MSRITPKPGLIAKSSIIGVVQLIRPATPFAQLWRAKCLDPSFKLKFQDWAIVSISELSAHTPYKEILKKLL